LSDPLKNERGCSPRRVFPSQFIRVQLAKPKIFNRATTRCRVVGWELTASQLAN